jgi:hypothetical protein
MKSYRSATVFLILRPILFILKTDLPKRRHAFNLSIASFLGIQEMVRGSFFLIKNAPNDARIYVNTTIVCNCDFT